MSKDNKYWLLEKIVDQVRLALFWLFIIGLSVSLYLAKLGWGVSFDPHSAAWPPVKVWQAVVLILWIIFPPIWFWFEYFFSPWRNNPSFGEDEKTRFERLKYGQDISSKIWLAVSTVLLMLYFGKDLKG